MDCHFATYILLEQNKDVQRRQSTITTWRLCDVWFNAQKEIKFALHKPKHNASGAVPRSKNNVALQLGSGGRALLPQHQPTEQQHIGQHDDRTDTCKRFTGWATGMDHTDTHREENGTDDP